MGVTRYLNNNLKHLIAIWFNITSILINVALIKLINECFNNFYIQG